MYRIWNFSTWQIFSPRTPFLCPWQISGMGVCTPRGDGGAPLWADSQLFPALSLSPFASCLTLHQDYHGALFCKIVKLFSTTAFIRFPNSFQSICEAYCMHQDYHGADTNAALFKFPKHRLHIFSSKHPHIRLKPWTQNKFDIFLKKNQLGIWIQERSNAVLPSILVGVCIGSSLFL